MMSETMIDNPAILGAHDEDGLPFIWMVENTDACHPCALTALAEGLEVVCDGTLIDDPADPLLCGLCGEPISGPAHAAGERAA